MNIKNYSRKKVGKVGEEIAIRFLRTKGYAIIDCNFRKPWGEIDVIAEKADRVHFIEVKCVSCESTSNGSREMDYRPEELVDQRKLLKLSKIASTYMEIKRDSREYQIDVVGVILVTNEQKAWCRLFKQVLE